MTNREISIGEVGEFGFIRSIQEGCHFSKDRLIRGIGDDCAVIGPYGDRVMLVTTDLLVEGVHFILDKIPPEQLGQKAAAVNLSDIAAMGGKALHLFSSLAIPPTMPVKILHAIYHGLKAMCRRHRVNILGGDTSASKEGLTISVSVIGEALKDEVIYRDGARPGDDIYVTGTLGDAMGGLKLIMEEVSGPETVTRRLINAHNLPEPHLEAGRVIARSHLASAMIDLSDGLLSDLRHICEASGVGAVIFKENLPVSEDLRLLAAENAMDPFEWALSGGEDYRLLVTVPRENKGTFQAIFSDNASWKIYRIGRITKGEGLKLRHPDGSEEQIEAAGWDHFTMAH